MNSDIRLGEYNSMKHLLRLLLLTAFIMSTGLASNLSYAAEEEPSTEEREGEDCPPCEGEDCPENNQMLYFW